VARLLSRLGACATSFLFSHAVLGSVYAQAAVIPLTCDPSIDTTCGYGSGHEIEVDGATLSGAPVVVAHPKSGAGPTAVILYSYAPACTGNDYTGDVLCGAAVNSCSNPAEIAFWVWTQSVDIGSAPDPNGWVRQLGSVCLGPHDPGLRPDAAINAYLATEFKRLMILKADVHAQPNGNTLVNYDTGFYSTTRDVVLPEFPLLGMTIRVTAHPQSYDWDFGDGTTVVDAGPGAKDALDVAHTYRRTGEVRVLLAVTWTGTFTVNGGPPRDVFGTAQTRSLPSPLRVKQARAELVTR
jgi:hypothetical protein